MKKSVLLGIGLLASVVSSQAALPGYAYINNEVYGGSGGVWVNDLSTAAPAGTFLQILTSTTSGGSKTLDVSTTITGVSVGGGGGFDAGEQLMTGKWMVIDAWYGAATYALAQTTPGAAWGTTGVFNDGSLSITPGGETVNGMLNPNLVMTVNPVPEPSTLAMAGLGGFGMLMALRRKKA